MPTSNLLTTLLAISGLTLAASRHQATTYHGISLSLQISDGDDPNVATSPAPIELNVLTHVGGTNCVPTSKITIDPNIHMNVRNISNIECHAYFDNDGIYPEGDAFTVEKPALLSSNERAAIAEILCYSAR
ncbi:hypothetical protein DL98DRAFT_514521 [Cadophora sp. DSE1049]|nr:hypothetical protein DL98DRAFT_514521 [Cadophora sp. DSE1049]